MTMNMAGLLLAAVLAVLSAAPAWAGEPPIQGKARIIDGDTVELRGHGGQAREVIRLYGLDAPEKGQLCVVDGLSWPCGAGATRALRKFIGGREVTCESRGRGAYGRMVGECRVGGASMNAWLVEQGLAVVPRRYSTTYVPQEEAARAAGRGLWRGEFTLPWEWRRQMARNAAAGEDRPAAPAPEAPDGDCAIKGNISKSGRIYHMPGGQWYERTRIDESRGEQWFCSEAEARQAGWRRARR